MPRLASQAFNAAAALTITGRNIVQHDDIGGAFLAAERGFRNHGLLDQPQARLDMLDQADEIRYDRSIAVILTVGSECDAVTCCIPHG